MIVAISGKAGSGKDTVAEMICNLLADQNYDDLEFQNPVILWKIKKFASKLKIICAILSGLSEEDMYSQEGKLKFLPDWNMTVRDMQIKVGTEAIRDNLHSNAWVIALMCDYKETEKWLITDLRFKNEFEYLKSKGAVCIRVERPGVKLIDHISETDLDNTTFDFRIVNDGSKEDLKEKVITLLSHLNHLIPTI